MVEKLFLKGLTSVMLRVELYDSSVTTGAMRTGMAYDTSNLVISIALDESAGATALTKEDITTIGTYEAPTGQGYVRFKEVDGTDMPGLYELHFHNTDMVGLTGFHLSIHGAANLKPRIFYVQNGVKLGNVAHGGGAASLQLGEGLDIDKTSGNAVSITATDGDGILVTGGENSSAGPRG